jgi:hypothetical protein
LENAKRDIKRAKVANGDSDEEMEDEDVVTSEEEGDEPRKVS